MQPQTHHYQNGSVRLPRERGWLPGKSGNFRGSLGSFRGSLGNLLSSTLPGKFRKPVKFHSERTSGEVAEKLMGKFGKLPGKSANFPEARGSLTPSQRLAKSVCNFGASIRMAFDWRLNAWHSYVVTKPPFRNPPFSVGEVHFKWILWFSLGTKAVKVLEIAVGAVFCPDQVLLSKIPSETLVADRIFC